MKRRHHPLISYIIRFCTSNIFLNSNMYVTAWLDKIMINLKTHICMHTKVNEASQKMSREQQINPYITLEDWLQMDYFLQRGLFPLYLHTCVYCFVHLFVCAMAWKQFRPFLTFEGFQRKSRSRTPLTKRP